MHTFHIGPKRFAPVALIALVLASAIAFPRSEASAQEIGTIALRPVGQEVTVGDIVHLDVEIRGVEPGVAVAVYRVAYPSALLELTDFECPPQAACNPQAGAVLVAEDYAPVIIEPRSVLSLDFMTMAPGTAELTIAPVQGTYVSCSDAAAEFDRCAGEGATVTILGEGGEPEPPPQQYRLFVPQVAKTVAVQPIVFDVPSTILMVGETREIEISVTPPQGVTGPAALTLDIGYDPEIVSAECVGGRATCNAIYPCNVNSPPSCEPDRIRLVDVSLSGLSGALAQIAFTGLQIGTFNYEITFVTCSNTQGQTLPNCQANPGGVIVEGGQ